MQDANPPQTYTCSMCRKQFEPDGLDPFYDNKGNYFCSYECDIKFYNPLIGIDFKIAIEDIPSPCKGICKTHEGICVGCGRETYEIKNWEETSDFGRIKIRARASKRLREIENEKENEKDH